MPVEKPSFAYLRCQQTRPGASKTKNSQQENLCPSPWPKCLYEQLAVDREAELNAPVSADDQPAIILAMEPRTDVPPLLEVRAALNATQRTSLDAFAVVPPGLTGFADR